MIEINNLVTPSPEWWEIVIHGLRLPLMSHERSDSVFMEIEPVYYTDREYYINDAEVTVESVENVFGGNYELVSWVEGQERFYLGEADKRLMLNLAKAGASDRKFLRQLPVIMEITAPEVFWRQMDTYKLATVANSSSQMHCLLKEPFKLSDFSFTVESDENDSLIEYLNHLREFYLEEKDKETKDKIWRDIVDHIPQSFNYTRCWTANYEVLLNIIKQRRGHKIKEWDQLIDIWLERIPLLKELNEVVNETNH